MKKKLGVGLALLLALALTACGEENATATDAPAAVTEAPAEETTGEPTAEPEETLPTEEPEADPEEETQDETEDEATISFDVEELTSLFQSFTGLRGTAGFSLKVCIVADSCLSYAQEKELYSLDDTSKGELASSVKEAFGNLKKKQQKEFRKTISEDVMPMITDSFQDAGVYKDSFEDSGLWDSWDELLQDPHIKDDWAVLWEALSEVL